MSIPTVLQRIIARKTEEVSARRMRLSEGELRARINDLPRPRGFAKALSAKTRQAPPAVIAEIKKASPSAGVIRQDFEPAWIAQRYQAAGAACLSVLTDVDFFQGHDDYLRQARDACDLPAIRKDFMIDPWQIYESRWLGADAVLLIVAALNDAMLHELHATARSLHLDVLVEVHNAEELQRAMPLRPTLLGINNRDLHRFKTDLAISEELSAMVDGDRPDHDCLVIAESGIHQSEDIQRLQKAGIQAYLVGESLMRRPDPGQALKELLGKA